MVLFDLEATDRGLLVVRMGAILLERPSSVGLGQLRLLSLLLLGLLLGTLFPVSLLLKDPSFLLPSGDDQPSSCLTDMELFG